MTDKFFNWIVFDLWFSQKNFFFQNLKIILLRGICTFSTIYEWYYFGDRTKWIRTKRGSPVVANFLHNYDEIVNFFIHWKLVQIVKGGRLLQQYNHILFLIWKPIFHPLHVFIFIRFFNAWINLYKCKKNVVDFIFTPRFL